MRRTGEKDAATRETPRRGFGAAAGGGGFALRAPRGGFAGDAPVAGPDLPDARAESHSREHFLEARRLRVDEFSSAAQFAERLLSFRRASGVRPPDPGPALGTAAAASDRAVASVPLGAARTPRTALGRAEPSPEVDHRLRGGASHERRGERAGVAHRRGVQASPLHGPPRERGSVVHHARLLQHLRAASLALAALEVRFQPGHPLGEPLGVLVDGAPHAVERGRKRPRVGRGERPRPPPLVLFPSLVHARRPPSLPRRPRRRFFALLLLLGVRRRRVDVLRGALEQRFELGAHRLVASVLRPHLGQARAKRPRGEALLPHPRRERLRLLAHGRDVRHTERRGRVFALHRVHEVGDVVVHRRRLALRRVHVVHHSLEPGLAGVAAGNGRGAPAAAARAAAARRPHVGSGSGVAAGLTSEMNTGAKPAGMGSPGLVDAEFACSGVENSGRAGGVGGGGVPETMSAFSCFCADATSSAPALTASRSWKPYSTCWSEAASTRGVARRRSRRRRRRRRGRLRGFRGRRRRGGERGRGGLRGRGRRRRHRGAVVSEAGARREGANPPGAPKTRESKPGG